MYPSYSLHEPLNYDLTMTLTSGMKNKSIRTPNVGSIFCLSKTWYCQLTIDGYKSGCDHGISMKSPNGPWLQKDINLHVYFLLKCPWQTPLCHSLVPVEQCCYFYVKIVTLVVFMINVIVPRQQKRYRWVTFLLPCYKSQTPYDVPKTETSSPRTYIRSRYYRIFEIIKAIDCETLVRHLHGGAPLFCTTVPRRSHILRLFVFSFRVMTST